MLSSKQIEVFYNIYRYKSMTAAASELKVSQPSISKTLGVIEKNLGFKLFLRKGKFLAPTDEAKELFEHASLVNSQLKNFNYVANSFKSRSLDFINIGTTPSLGESIVPEIITKYKRINPAIRFNIINLNSIDLIEDRYKPDIDITICFNAKEQNSIDIVVLKEGKHYLVSAKKYNLGKKVSLKEITDLPYIEITNLLSVYAKSSIMNFLIENEINMNFYLKTDSYTSALAIINQGIGVAIIDENTIQNANLELVNVSKIIDNSFEYCINAIMKKNIPRDESREFFNFLSLQAQ